MVGGQTTLSRPMLRAAKLARSHMLAIHAKIPKGPVWQQQQQQQDAKSRKGSIGLPMFYSISCKRT